MTHLPERWRMFTSTLPAVHDRGRPLVTPFARRASTGALLLLLAACGGAGDTAAPAVVTEVAVTRPAESIPSGGATTLTAVLRDASGKAVTGTITWQSSNPSVATVSASGVVTGVSPGQVTITASAGGVSSTVTLIIRGSRALTTFAVSPPAATMNLGETVTFAPAITQPPLAPVPRVSWSTSNAAVATVSAAGSVTAVGTGLATISAVAVTDAELGYAADTLRSSAVATVLPASPAIANLTVSPTSARINATNIVQLVPTVQRANGTVQPTYTYTTSLATVATVSATGQVTGVDQGTATITVTAQAPASIGLFAVSLSRAVTITVVRPPSITGLFVQPQSMGPMAPGDTQTITQTVAQPAGAATAVVTYTSSAPAIASVANGVVTANAPGNAVITVTANAAGTPAFAAAIVSAVVPVNVSAPALTWYGTAQGPTFTSTLDSLTANGSIRGLRVGPNGQAGAPLDIFNVRDEIVLSAIATRAPDSIAIIIADAVGANPVMLETRRGGMAAGVVSVRANTADVTIDAAAGTASPRIPNGLRSVRMVGWYRGAGGAVQSIFTTALLIQINNVDGFALQLTPPTRSATSGGGHTWTGGNGANGVGTFTVIPVIYTTGRTISAVTLSFGRCAGTVTKSAVPFRATFGGVGSGADINCAGVIGSIDAADAFRAEDYPMVTASTDNIGGAGAGPRVTYVYDPGAGAHPWAGPRPSLWRASTTFISPPAIRVDYTGAIVPP